MIQPPDCSVIAATLVAAGTAVLATQVPAADYSVRPVPLMAVHVQDSFWSPRLDTNRLVTLWHDLKQCEEHGQLHNFAKAGGLMAGEFRTRPPRDSDIYKIIEGASYMLAVERDAALEQYLDDLIVQIAAAQEPDGYLYTARRLLPPDKMPAISGPKRWLNEQASHELYVAGHLYEAAVAYYQATAKRALLDVAIKNANLVAKDFGPGKLQLPPGHQGIEIGLAKLFRVTGERKYLALTKFFIDVRGRPETHPLFGVYCQDHQPVLEQNEAVGHAVRACYLYCGMAEVAALTGETNYVRALDRLWEDVVNKKLSLTGGVGPKREGEAFGKAYDLPNLGAYNETCAAIANALWSYRMFLLHGEARYLDVVERILYNGFLSGVSLNGDRFFYQNPLASEGGYGRIPWFSTPCCPVNVVRFLPGIASWIYATRGRDVLVNLFIGGSATVALEGGLLRLTQSTAYPWEGQVKVAVEPERPVEFTLGLRLPGWAQNQPVPGDLYRFTDTSEAQADLRLNGRATKFQVQDGFARLTRRWQKGDLVELALPMPIRRVVAHGAVKDNLGRVALQRGPMVYCAEGVDNHGHVSDLVLPDAANLSAEHRPELLGGVTVIRGAGLTAVPYYSWAHRGDGEMTVWLAREAETFRDSGRGPEPSYRFGFGSTQSTHGLTPVTPTNLYHAGTGFGFVPGARVRAQRDFVTSDNPFLFSVKLPEGNYAVTLTLGDEAGESSTTVKAEARRLMIGNARTAQGEVLTRTITVNVRTARINAGGQVRLKQREKDSERVTWDDALTLEFNGPRPCLRTVEIAPAPSVPTVFIAGDSTVCDQPNEPWNSWGQMLPCFFKPGVAVANYAQSGESIKSSLSARRFEKIFSLMKPGDWLLVQFGHNDMKDRTPDALATYQANLNRLVAETRQKGGTPVLITSMERKAGVNAPTLGGYPDAVRTVAREEKVALVDLQAMSVRLYQALGSNLDGAFQDGTHHNSYGSYELAKCVAAGIAATKVDLARFLVEDVRTFDPAHPDPIEKFDIPPSPSRSSVKPEGN